MNAGMIEHKNDLTKVECKRRVIDQALVNCLVLGPWGSKWDVYVWVEGGGLAEEGT